MRARPAGARLRLFFHPQRGAVALEEGRDLNPMCLRYRGGQDSAWTVVASFEADRAPDGTLVPRAGQGLPAGFLWGDASRQHFGMGGPQLAFGPLQRKCRTCGQPFTFTAKEQKRWLEDLGFHIDSTAVRCGACRAGLRKVERARRRWEAALKDAGRGEAAKAQLSLAEAGLALLRAGAGGRTVLEKATAASRRAQRLGAGAAADEAERALQSLRRAAR